MDFETLVIIYLIVLIIVVFYYVIPKLKRLEEEIYFKPVLIPTSGKPSIFDFQEFKENHFIKKQRPTRSKINSKRK